MSGNRQVKFEVYAMQGGRWNIHTHYDANYRDDAVEEAMRVEREPGVMATCVMRSSYNAINNESTDSVIYHTPSLNGRPSVASLSKNSGSKITGSTTSTAFAPAGSAAANAAADYERRDKEFQMKQKREMNSPPAVPYGGNMGDIPEFLGPYEDESDSVDFVKLSVAFVTSSMIATASAGALYFTLRSLEFNLGRNPLMITLAATFGTTFLLFFIPMVKRLAMVKGRDKQRLKYASQQTSHYHLPEQAIVENNFIDPFMSDLQEAPPTVDDLPAHVGDDAIPYDELIAELTVPAEELVAEEISSLPEGEDDFFPEEMGQNQPETIRATQLEPEITHELQIARDADALDAGAINEIRPLLFVLAREAKNKYGATLATDAYLRFGAILFLSGAAEIIAREFGVTKKNYLQVLIDAVVEIGAERAHAHGFCANIDEYLLDERYLSMYGAGRNAGKAKLRSASAKSGFIDWLEYWKTPDGQPNITAGSSQGKTPDGKQFVAVLFTDIVDSTTQQQEMGDEWMMQVVHLHNKAVRDGLKSYGGREIKHLGDGIMASFSAVDKAVAASIAMQRGFTNARTDSPNHPFEVRVGISAGEPIHDGGDIFGTPVNLAARVLTKAGPGQIAVSSVVKDMCEGQAFEFIEVGKVQLKGFSAPQMIFHVNLS